jgi:hypothetical protein
MAITYRFGDEDEDEARGEDGDKQSHGDQT